MISAALLPLAGDGVIAAASAAMLVASRQGRAVPLRARVMLIAGIAATIAANLAYGLPEGRTGALLSVWPVAAYVGCMELLTWMRQHTGMQPVKAWSATVSASSDAVADAPVVTVKPVRVPTARQVASDLLAAAEERWPDGKLGKIPPLRDIQSALSIGQPKAQRVQAHFRELAAQAA